MKDVARLAGVSTATVSAVLNNVPVVSAKCVQRVREAMETLEYRPDAVARSLRTGKSYVIGVVIPDITNPFFADVIRGIEEAAAEQRYSVIVCNTNEDSTQEQRQLEGLQSRRADGLIITCSRHTSNYDDVVRRRMPVVFVDQTPHEVDAALVASDHFGGAVAATDHLIQLGHQRIAVLARDLSLLAQRDRVDGYRHTMQRAGLPIREEYFRVGGDNEEDGYRFGRQLLELGEPPTAVFSCNNKMLAGLLRAMGECGVSCPEQISVVGFDDHIWMRAYHPPLSTVAQRTYDIGRIATNALLDQISEPSTTARTVTMVCDLIVRSSTGKPRP
jgi:LacI family transcriptional regulator